MVRIQNANTCNYARARLRPLHVLYEQPTGFWNGVLGFGKVNRVHAEGLVSILILGNLCCGNILLK